MGANIAAHKTMHDRIELSLCPRFALALLDIAAETVAEEELPAAFAALIALELREPFVGEVEDALLVAVGDDLKTDDRADPVVQIFVGQTGAVTRFDALPNERGGTSQLDGPHHGMKTGGGKVVARDAADLRIPFAESGPPAGTASLGREGVEQLVSWSAKRKLQRKIACRGGLGHGAWLFRDVGRKVVWAKMWWHQGN